MSVDAGSACAPLRPNDTHRRRGATPTANFDAWPPRALAILRIMTGLLFRRGADEGAMLRVSSLRPSGRVALLWPVLAGFAALIAGNVLFALFLALISPSMLAVAIVLLHALVADLVQGLV